MPPDGNMFTSIMKLLISCHRDRAIVIPFDDNGRFLWVADFII